MDRFNELERTWEERRKKRKLALTAIGGGVLLLLAVYFIMPIIQSQAQPTKPEAATVQAVPDKQTPQEPTAAKPVKPAQPSAAIQTPKATEPLPAKEVPQAVAKKMPLLKDPLTITLDRSFEHQIDTDLERYTRQKTEKEESTPAPSEPLKPSVSADPQTDNETSGLQIKSETVDDSEKIGLLIDNYEFDQTYENAMKITRHYFASQDYPNAIQWSLKANQLDSADDESWLIFAKASIAVGEGEQAKKALQTYLQKRDSIRVRQLYQTIK